MADTETNEHNEHEDHSHDDHSHGHDDHGHHDHGEFIAHHFDNAEQQFDSGKLGIWLFLVTEVLFFSGLFVAYTLYRVNNPEIFDQAHGFLNKWLGGMNTIVLLFSSLTMAWAVRCAQMKKNKSCAMFVLITMVCATIFLGVKAVEYSHKWDMGILPRSMFAYTTHHPDTGMFGLSKYLIYLSALPALLVVVFAGLSLFNKTSKNNHGFQFWGGMAITVLGYFLGVVTGLVFMAATEGGHEEHASLNSPVVLHAQEAEAPHADEKDAGHDEANHKDEHGHDADGHDHGGDGHVHEDHSDHAEHGSVKSANNHGPDPEDFNRDIGLFFSVYYCMTGLHAIHIIAGIAALGWLYWRSLAGHWRSDYFGPVDYVGLYWHLVDLIWIYLFPMLYLID